MLELDLQRATDAAAPDDAAFRRWCVEPVAAIVAALKARHPHVPIIAFPRAAGLLYEDYVANVPADAFGLDQTVPLDWAQARIQRGLGRAIQGNLDPQLLVAGGEALTAEVDRILHAATKGPFVFNLGHGIPKTTPPEHVAALVRQVQGWRG